MCRYGWGCVQGVAVGVGGASARVRVHDAACFYELLGRLGVRSQLS